MCRLQDLVRKSEQGLGTAEGHISSLQEAQEILQKELELTRARLRETTDSLYSVEVTLMLENESCKYSHSDFGLVFKTARSITVYAFLKELHKPSLKEKLLF